MNAETSAKPELYDAIEMSFRLTGRYVDEEVAKGRHVDDILAIEQGKPGGKNWFNRNALRHYSNAVAKSSQEAN